MIHKTTTRWLLVTFALLGIVLAAPVVSAHAADPGAADVPQTGDMTSLEWNGTAADRAAWMETRMATHMGPEGLAWMEARMGQPVGEMTHWMVEGVDHPMWNDDVNRVPAEDVRDPVDDTYRGPNNGVRGVTADDDRWRTDFDRRGMAG